MTAPNLIVYEQPALWQSRPMKFRTSISIDPELAKIAQKMSVDFEYNNFSKLIEDLIRSASEADEIVYLPAEGGRPAMRLFVTSRPDSPRARKKR